MLIDGRASHAKNVGNVVGRAPRSSGWHRNRSERMDFDVIVLGAGMASVSSALHLRDRGRRVALLGVTKPQNCWFEAELPFA
jgi:ribulose 1,5-bisphosphate synthetase/thiazole synthase